MSEPFVTQELHSQPSTWIAARNVATQAAHALPAPGEKIAIVGCGTSWFMAQAYGALRESTGHGLSDAFVASEYPVGRHYDRVVALTRSGTTSEVIELLTHLDDIPTVTITAVGDSPAALAADEVIVMEFADECSVVQTRFATTALALLRANLGEDIDALAAQADEALTIDITPLLGADQVTFLGRGWTVGLANEAALKAREAAQFWSESYPGMDYRHGPISIAQPGRLVWFLGEADPRLVEDAQSTGATVVHHDLDGMAALIVAQRFAVAKAQAQGLDPDHPRSLTRSVIL